MDVLIHKITLREWSYYTKTGDLSGLKKYNVNKRNLNELLTVIDEHLGEKLDLEKEKENLNSKFKIQELIMFYRNLNHLMVHQLKVELWLIELGVDTDTNERLNLVIKNKIEQLKNKYGISISIVEDLKKIDDEITRRLDKYAENNQAKEEKEGITFTELMIGVFKVLGYDKIDYEMVLSDFFELKKLAYKQVK